MDMATKPERYSILLASCDGQIFIHSKKLSKELYDLADYTIKGAPSLSLVLKMVKILQNHYPVSRDNNLIHSG